MSDQAVEGTPVQYDEEGNPVAVAPAEEESSEEQAPEEEKKNVSAMLHGHPSELSDEDREELEAAGFVLSKEPAPKSGDTPESS